MIIQGFLLKKFMTRKALLKGQLENIDFRGKKIKIQIIFSPRLLNLLRSHKIKNIIITGMGSCYTAGKITKIFK